MKPIPDATHINLMLPLDLLRRIDEVRRAAPRIPNRSETIRMLLAAALDKPAKPARRAKRAK